VPLYTQSGALTFPLDPADFTDTLAQLDPARDTLLALFAAAINDEFGTVWSTVAAGVEPLAGTSTVQSTWPGPPSLELVQHLVKKFPCLFLYRDGESEANEYTLAQDQIAQNWILDYILVPLAADDFRKVGDIFVGVVKLLQRVTKRKGHPAYQSGALVTTGTGLSTVELTKHRWGGAKFSEESPTYLALTVQFRTTELTQFVDGEHGAFEAFDLDAGTGNGDGLVDPLIQAASDVELKDPAIVGGSPLYVGRRSSS